jgi:hypothetical protein
LNISIAPDRIDAMDEMVDVYVEGELRYELWEDPERPFGCAPRDIEQYTARAAWVLLFNALALTGAPRVTEPAA